MDMVLYLSLKEAIPESIGNDFNYIVIVTVLRHQAPSMFSPGPSMFPEPSVFPEFGSFPEGYVIVVYI